MFVPRPLPALLIFVLLAALFFIGRFAPPVLLAPSRVDGPAIILFKPVALDSHDPARTKLGALTFLGALFLVGDASAPGCRVPGGAGGY